MARTPMSQVIPYGPGTTLTSNMLDQICAQLALQSDMAAVQSGAATFSVAGGTSDAITVSIPAITALVDGTQINVRAVAANTTTTPTITINALGTFTVTKLGSQPLDIGDIQPDLEITLRYDAIGPKFQLLKSVLTAIPSIAALRGKVGVNNQVVFVSAYYAGIAGGDGNFFWNATSAATDDGGHVINPTGNTTGRWMRMLTGGVWNVKNFGAKGLAGGVADDSPFCQAAINSCIAAGVTNNFQGSYGAQVRFPADSYVIGTSLNTGAATAINSINNTGMWLRGDGRGNTVLHGSIVGPIIALDCFDASVALSDMFVANTGGMGVRVRGNGQLISNLWLNAVYGIYIESWIDGTGTAVGSGDIQIRDIVGDQCFNATIVIANNSGAANAGPGTISMNNIESFGGASAAPFQQGIVINGSAKNISINGYKVSDSWGQGIVLTGDATGRPEVTLSGYNIEGSSAILTGATGANHRGIVVNGGKLTLGEGTVSLWSAEGIFGSSGPTGTAGNSVIIDNGAVVHDCCLSSAATSKSLIFGVQTDYMKSAGSCTGNGAAGLELAAINIVGNTAGSLQVGPAVRISNMAAKAIVCSGAGGGTVKFASIQGVVVDSCNLANVATNTPIDISGTDVANVANCIIKNTNTTTAAIASSATAGNYTYNLAKSGTFPVVATHVQSVGNALY